MHTYVHLQKRALRIDKVARAVLQVREDHAFLLYTPSPTSYLLYTIHIYIFSFHLSPYYILPSRTALRSLMYDKYAQRSTRLHSMILFGPRLSQNER